MDNEKTNHDDHDHDDHEKKDDKRHVCHICNQSFSSGQGLGGHMRIHFLPNPNPNPNPIPNITIDLGRIFDNWCKSNLTHVEQVHQKVGSCKCNICYQNFPSKQDLEGHMRLHFVVPCSGSGSGSGSDKRHVCNICGKSFSSGSALGGHKRTHYSPPNPIMKNNPNQTLDLARFFHDWYMSNLTHDKEVHQEVGFHRCKICDQNLPSGQDLESHMRLHNVSCSGSGSGSRSGSGSGQSSSQTGQGVGRTPHEFDLNVPAVDEDQDEDAGVE